MASISKDDLWKVFSLLMSALVLPLADIEGMIGWSLSRGRNDNEDEVMRKIGARLAYMAKTSYPVITKAMLEELQDQ